MSLLDCGAHSLSSQYRSDCMTGSCRMNIEYVCGYFIFGEIIPNWGQCGSSLWILGGAASTQQVFQPESGSVGSSNLPDED